MPLSILNDAGSSGIYKACGERFCTQDLRPSGSAEFSLRLSNYRLFEKNIFDKAPRLPDCSYYLMLVSSGYGNIAFPSPSSLAVVIDNEVVGLEMAGVSTSGAKGRNLLDNYQDSPAAPVADVYEMQPFLRKIAYYHINAQLIKRMTESGSLYLRMDNRNIDLMKIDIKRSYTPLTFIEGCKMFYNEVVSRQCGNISNR